MKAVLLALALSSPAAASTLLAVHPAALDASMFLPEAHNPGRLILSLSVTPEDPATYYNGMLFEDFVIPQGSAIFVGAGGLGGGNGFAFSSANYSFDWARWDRNAEPALEIEFYEFQTIRISAKAGCDATFQCSENLLASDPRAVAMLGSGTMRIGAFRPDVPPVPEPAAFAAFGLGLVVLATHRLHRRRSRSTAGSTRPRCRSGSP